jgi:hypothetical protein
MSRARHALRIGEERREIYYPAAPSIVSRCYQVPRGLQVNELVTAACLMNP